MPNLRTANRRRLRKVERPDREIGPIGCMDFTSGVMKTYFYMLWGRRELRHTPKGWG